MTPQEFKAWFDGFTEGLEGTPSKKQWERIKVRVAEIDGAPVTYYRYLEDYWRPYYRPWVYGSVGISGLASNLQCYNGSSAANFTGGLADANQISNNFNSTTAMYALGKADSESLNG